MKTKLTLTIEDRVIKKAKIYAQKRNQSLSGLIENYLKVLTMAEHNKSLNFNELSPKLNALRGSFKMPKDFNYKEELEKTLSEKFLK